MPTIHKPDKPLRKCEVAQNKMYLVLPLPKQVAHTIDLAKYNS